MAMSAPQIPDGYAEHPPPAEIASIVECFWTRRVQSSVELLTHRVLPDGCVDIILAFDRGAPSAVGVGAMTKPLVVRGRSPALSIGVRFRPGFALAAFGLPASELTDETVAWSLLARDADEELAHLAAASDDDARLRGVIAMVARRFAAVAPPPAAVRESLRRIVAADGMLRIASLAPEIGVSRQQLARLFAVHVGVAPKVLARVMRVRAAIARADAARADAARGANPYGVDWSAVAYDLGYYDQPHLVDEFKAITGLTPGAWGRE